MDTSRLMILFVFIICILAGCDMSKYEPVTVAVYPSTHKCTIHEQPVDCRDVGSYLRDTLKADTDRQIDVSYTGSDPGVKGDKMLDQVADTVRAAGFKKVNAARFD